MSDIVLSPSGKKIPCEQGQTVLSALEKAGYALPNNCRAGACGECKVKVLAGAFDQGFILDMALPASEREQGYGLMCMAKPTSESLEIEWATADAKPKLFAPEENLPYFVLEKHLVSQNIVKLKLRSLGKPMRFWPGQYVTIGSHNTDIPTRSYSIANIPNHEGDLVFFITRLNNGGTSQWIHDQLREGEILNLNGPYGTFIGDPSTETPVLCLAAGSGLAPILSLASAALMRGGFKHPAQILFSAKTKDDLFELGNMGYLKQKFKNFDFQYTLTQEANEGGLAGRIPTLLPSLYPDLSNTSIYIAGSPEFVESCVLSVTELGAKAELIHQEGFTSQN